MIQILAAAANAGALGRLWFLPPLVIIVSLVYSASRYESPGRILRRASKYCLQIGTFMAVVLGVLAWLSAGL